MPGSDVRVLHCLNAPIGIALIRKPKVSEWDVFPKVTVSSSSD